MLITDVNEDEITVGARVEYVGPSDFAYGMVGRVDEIKTTDGFCAVEFDAYGFRGETYEIHPTNLRVLTDDEWNRAVGAGC